MKVCPDCGYRCSDSDNSCPNCSYIFEQKSASGSTAQKSASITRIWSEGTSKIWATMITIGIIIGFFRIVYVTRGITFGDMLETIGYTIVEYYRGY